MSSYEGANPTTGPPHELISSESPPKCPVTGIQPMRREVAQVDHHLSQDIYTIQIIS